MAQKDAKDILRDIKADIESISSNDIQFKDLRKKRTKKQEVKKTNESESVSDIINNQEGFSVMSVETTSCDYRDIAKKGRLKEKHNLEEWGAYDFFKFAHKLYLEKYKENWELNIGGNSIEINRIRDKFYDLFGFCCNLIMHDYIIWFFDNYIDHFKREKGEFYFSQMRKDWVLISFQENYNFQERFMNYIAKEKQKDKKYDLTKDEMEKSFLMGDTTLVGNYGVVIALNWLLKIKRMTKKNAIELVVNACKDMYSKDLIDIVKNATEIYSPYPSNLYFKSPQLVFNKINPTIQLNVEFVESNKIQFLQKRR